MKHGLTTLTFSTWKINVSFLTTVSILLQTAMKTVNQEKEEVKTLSTKQWVVVKCLLYSKCSHRLFQKTS